MRTPYLLAGFIVAVVALVLGRIIHEDSTRPGDAPTLRALYAIEPPFAYIDAHGRVTGEAPEMLRVLAKRAGFGEVEFIHAEFSQLLHDLQAGRADIVASGLFVTPERAQRARFTRPTAQVSSALLVGATNPLDLHGLDDVAARHDAVLAVIDGAIELTAAKRAGVPTTRIQRHGDAASAAVAVIDGRADALALSDVSLHHMLAVSGLTGVELAQPYRPPQHEGRSEPGWPAFALRPQDEALARRIDEAMAGFLGSPAHRALVEPFGFGPENLPAPAQR
jgi:polar amino acid transport system substrate-binding protein